MRNLICLFIFLSLLLEGCRPAASPAIPTVKATIPPTPTTMDKNLPLKLCSINGINAECGSLHVPEDRKNPHSRILDLAIVVVRANGPDHEPDPLFYLAGGPGEAATGEGYIFNASSIFREVHARRDIIFLDQRGTNDEHRLSCEDPSFLIRAAPQQQVEDWMKGCLASLDGDPRFYTTAEAMRDLDEARAALGYDKINLYGISYGVTAAQVYMRMFPEHVRTAVLDHGTALGLPFIYALPRASQSVLNQVFTSCEQDEECHASYPDIRGDWRAVLDRVAKGPVVTSYYPPGAEDPEQVTMDDVANGIHTLLKDGYVSTIPKLIHELAANEDWTPVVKGLNEQYANRAPADNSFLFMANVIFCFEPAWGYDPDEVSRLNPGSYYRDYELEWAQGQQKICTALPEPDPSLIYGPGKPVPLSALIFNSLLDPQNPPANMDLALKEFTQSRIVVERTGGHDTSYSDCRWQIITQYIQQGSVDGLDTTCAENTKLFFFTGND